MRCRVHAQTRSLPDDGPGCVPSGVSTLMTSHAHPRTLVLRAAAALTTLALLAALLILPAAPQNAQAQGLRRTPSGGGILSGGMALPTRGAPALNLTPGALSTLAAGAAGALSNPAYPALAATAEALMTQAAGIAGGAYSDAYSGVLATAQALATQAYVDLPAIQATAATIATAAVEYDWDELAAEAMSALEDVLSTANVTYNPEDGSLLVTTVYSEAMINALLDASLVATGLNPEQVNVDLIPGGLILTVSGYTAGQTVGTLVIQAAAGIADGALTYSIVAVTFNGAPLPAAWMAEVEALFADVPLETVLIEELIGELSAYGEVSYQVEDLLVTDTELYLTVSAWFVLGG